MGAAAVGLLASTVAVVGVRASQVLPTLPAIDTPPIDGAPADTLTLYAAPSPIASVRLQAPTGVLTVWLTPVSAAVKGAIGGATSDSPPALRVPVTVVVSACAATGAAANADKTTNPATIREPRVGVSLFMRYLQLQTEPLSAHFNRRST